MKLSFKSLMITVTRGARTTEVVTVASVSVKKDKRGALSTSNRIKLSRVVREAGSEKFAFLETDGKVGNTFKAVYELHMQIEALYTALTYFDIDNVFQIIPT